MRKRETDYIGQVIKRYEEVESTNTEAKKWAKQDGKEGHIIVAETQTAGKGRRGRHWVSPKGVGIWMSMILKPNVDMTRIPQITLLAGYAMCEALRKVSGEPIQIKWPNDLVLGSKKICGVLCEASIQANQVQAVIVGIGVNVNTENFETALPYASSLKKETGRCYDREEIIATFCEYFEPLYEAYQAEGDLSSILSNYKRYCINFYNKTKIIDNNTTYEAEVIDLEADGALIVVDNENRKKRIIAGEVSVRGLYDYV